MFSFHCSLIMSFSIHRTSQDLKEDTEKVGMSKGPTEM